MEIMESFRQLADLSLHVELRELGREIRSACTSLGVECDELVPTLSPVIPILPNRTVIGNWPAYCRARATGQAEVPVLVRHDLGFEDAAVVTVVALTSVARRGFEDPLLLGTVYRRWAGYEACLVPLRASAAENRFFREQHGMTRREYLQRELSRRLGRSVRELQRLACVLDAPAEWLKLHRSGQVSLAVLERICALPRSDRDELMDDLKEGVPVSELVADYGLRIDRKDRRIDKQNCSIAK